MQQAAPAFDFRLRPHRSLGPRGFLILMALIGSISFITGLLFMLQGAWPVFGFLGLDVALICSAALLLSFLATLYPSWRAAQVQPAEALRYE